MGMFMTCDKCESVIALDQKAGPSHRSAEINVWHPKLRAYYWRPTDVPPRGSSGTILCDLCITALAIALKAAVEALPNKR